MPPIASSFNDFEDLDTKGSPPSASARDGIWLLDDDALHAQGTWPVNEFGRFYCGEV